MLLEDSFLTIAAESTGEYRERGSKFIGLAFPVKNEEEIKIILNKIKKEHPQANHHCYAFRLTTDPTVFRSSDDREPSGSAGKPILGAIQSKGLTNILIIVVRYFGGSLLGVPGLINAYRTAAQQSIENAKIVEQTISDCFSITFPYSLINDTHQLLRTFPVQIKFQEYTEPCKIIFDLRRGSVIAFENKLKTHPTLSYQSTFEPYTP